jgi:acetate kinase
MRELTGRDDPDACLAFDVYMHRLLAGVGAMAAALEGLDALAFTGGVGEGSARVRQVACEALSHLGVVVDGRRNETVSEDADIAAEASRVAVLVIRAREDVEIARQARTLLG